MKLLLISFIFLISFWSKAQEEGGETSVPAETPAAETPVTTVDNASKLGKPLGRVKSSTGVNNESSSLMGDPDSVDPLNPNRDNIKDDNEPVLEDIKTILNAPKKSKKKAAEAAAPPAATPPPAEAAAVPPAAPPAPEVAPAPPPPEITVETPPPPAPPVEEAKPAFTADDPDLILEKKFNDIFKLYNINPTPDDIWAAASSKQTARLYEVQKGDTLWSISKILFGDPNFWPKLWSLNKQGILNPHFINPKMKIYFYEGDEENAPTLSVGAQAKAEEAPAAEEEAVTETAKDEKEAKEEAPKGAADADNPDAKPHVAYVRSKLKHPSPLPPSLPISRNEKYYSPKTFEQEIRIDLGQEPSFPLQINNDIVITDEPVTSEVQIELSEVAKFRCNDGRILKEIKFTGSLAPDYDIYEQLDDLETTTGTKHVYRLYGHAQPYQSQYLKVVDCNSIMSTELLLLPKDKMKEMNTRKTSDTTEAKLIGGPDVREQRVFQALQYAFVDFGASAFSPGQEYKTISRLTDQVNAEFKIVEKYGSYAVVLITDVNDLVEVGDKVVYK